MEGGVEGCPGIADEIGRTRGFRVTRFDDPDAEHALLDPGSQRAVRLAGMPEAASEWTRELMAQK